MLFLDFHIATQNILKITLNNKLETPLEKGNLTHFKAAGGGLILACIPVVI